MNRYYVCPPAPVKAFFWETPLSVRLGDSFRVNGVVYLVSVIEHDPEVESRIKLRKPGFIERLFMPPGLNE